MTGPADAVRICFVVSTHPAVIMGGAQYQAHLLAEELARRDHVSVTYIGRDVPRGDAAATLPYAVYKVGTNGGLRRRSLLFDASNLWRVLRVIQPQIIYQRMKQVYTGVCGLYARRHEVPLVFHVASAADVQLRTARRWSASTPLDVAEAAIGNWGLQHAAHIMVQNNEQGAQLRRNFAREPSRIVRNFQPLRTDLPLKAQCNTRVLWVGNFKDVKRPDLFVRLAQHFTDRSDVEFQMVGMPAEHRRFDALMAQIGRSPNLRYFGGLPLAEVNELMAQADVLVSTSSFEGFPNTFIQAWANGAVVVSLAVDIDGGLEAQGIGYCAGNFDRLIAIIVELASSPELRRAIALRGFQHVQENHSMSNAAQLADFMLAQVHSVSRLAVK